MPLNKTEQNAGAFVSFLALALFSLYFTFSAVGMANEARFLMVFGGMTIAALVLCIVLLARLRRENKSAEIDYLNIGVQRHILGLFMIFYGLPKLFGNFFDYQLFALDSKLGAVSEFELAWYYFGKNKWQELFAGVMEFVPGVMLFYRRTYYIGALILLPVTAQVFILNFFFKIGGVTFPAATVLLVCNLYILYSQRERIVQFFKSLDFTVRGQFGKTASVTLKICKWTCIILAAFLVFRSTKAAFFKPGNRAGYEKLVGAYTLETMRKNHVDYLPTSDSLVFKDLYIEKQSRWNILRRYNSETDAFVINLNENDSIDLYINKGGIGDSRDILDSLTVLKGIYKKDGDLLTIRGVQMGDTLELNYRKLDIKPKEWFW